MRPAIKCKPHFLFYAPTHDVAPRAVSIADAIDLLVISTKRSAWRDLSTTLEMTFGLGEGALRPQPLWFNRRLRRRHRRQRTPNRMVPSPGSGTE
jgi:hypothetical protein